MTIYDLQKMRDLFAKRLIKLLDENNHMDQTELSDMLGLDRSTVNKWVKAKALPRMGVVEKLCSIFGVKKSYFFEENGDTDVRSYYLDKEAAQYVQQIANQPGLRILLDASRDLTVADINAVVEIVKRMSKRNDDENEGNQDAKRAEY